MKALLKIAKGKKSRKINLIGGALESTLVSAASEGIVYEDTKMVEPKALPSHERDPNLHNHNEGDITKNAFKASTIAKSVVGAGLGAYAGKKYDDNVGHPDDQHGRARRIGTGILAGAVTGSHGIPLAAKGIKKVLKTNHKMGKGQGFGDASGFNQAKDNFVNKVKSKIPGMR